MIFFTLYLTKMKNPTQNKIVFALVLFAGVIVTVLIQI